MWNKWVIHNRTTILLQNVAKFASIKIACTWELESCECYYTVVTKEGVYSLGESRFLVFGIANQNLAFLKPHRLINRAV